MNHKFVLPSSFQSIIWRTFIGLSLMSTSSYASISAKPTSFLTSTNLSLADHQWTEINNLAQPNFDIDPYTLFKDAVANGYIFDDSTPDELQSRFSEANFHAGIPEFLATSSPDTVVLDQPISSLNRFANDFDFIIVVNTAATGKKDLREMGYIFEKNLGTNADQVPFIYKENFYVSSGVYENRTVPLFASNLDPLLKEDGTPVTKTYFAGTEAGYFPVNFTERSHKSATLRKHDPLQFFVGFNPKDGQGLHLEKVINHTRLSNGCIRLRAATAEKLFFKANMSYSTRTDSSNQNQLRYMDKLTGNISTIEVPEEVQKLTSRFEYQKAINRIERETFGARRGDFNPITSYRTLVIVNDEPDRDFSELAAPNPLAPSPKIEKVEELF